MGRPLSSVSSPGVRPTSSSRESSRERPLSRSMDRPGNSSSGGKPNSRSGSNGRTATPITTRPVKKTSPSASHKVPGQSPRISLRWPSTEQSLELSLGAVLEQEQSYTESAVPPPPPLDTSPPSPLPNSTVAERAHLNSFELAQWALTRASSAAAAAEASTEQNGEEEDEDEHGAADTLREVEDEDYGAKDAMPPYSMPPPPPLTESPSHALNLSTPRSFRTRMATMRAVHETSGTNTVSCGSSQESVQSPSEDILSSSGVPLAISDLVEPSRHGEMLYVPNQESPNVQFVDEVIDADSGVEDGGSPDTIKISDLAETMDAIEKQMANSSLAKIEATSK